MTGYGRGVAERGAARAAVEVRTVNHRFLDLKLRGGAVGAALEEAIGARVRAAIERGAVAITLNLGAPAAGGATRVDAEAARRVHAELAALAAQLGVAPPDLALVLAQPGVVRQAGAEATTRRPPCSPRSTRRSSSWPRCARPRAPRSRPSCARLDELGALRAAIAGLAARCAPVRGPPARARRPPARRARRRRRRPRRRRAARPGGRAARRPRRRHRGARPPRLAPRAGPRARRRRGRRRSPARLPRPGARPRAQHHRQQVRPRRHQRGHRRRQGHPREDPRAGPERRVARRRVLAGGAALGHGAAEGQRCR